MEMKFTSEWLERKLAIADDSEVAAGTRSVVELEKEVNRRAVTPSILSNAPTNLAKVVRYVREQRGWTQKELAEIATLEESEIRSIETDLDFAPSPRALVYLSDALGLSRDRLKSIVGYVSNKSVRSIVPYNLKFAANSCGFNVISAEEFEAVRALVEVLSEKR